MPVVFPPAGGIIKAKTAQKAANALIGALKRTEAKNPDFTVRSAGWFISSNEKVARVKIQGYEPIEVKGNLANKVMAWWNSRTKF